MVEAPKIETMVSRGPDRLRKTLLEYAKSDRVCYDPEHRLLDVMGTVPTKCDFRLPSYVKHHTNRKRREVSGLEQILGCWIYSNMDYLIPKFPDDFSGADFSAGVGRILINGRAFDEYIIEESYRLLEEYPNLVRDLYSEIFSDPWFRQTIIDDEYELWYNDAGDFDVDMIATGMSKDDRKEMDTVFGVMDGISTCKRSFSEEDVFSEAMKAGLAYEEIEQAMSRLKMRGAIYSPRKGELRIT